jgi:hypothetical protein
MTMTAALNTKLTSNQDRYARCIAASKRIRWDIDQDVIRGRSFDYTQKFLPDGLSMVPELTFLTQPEQRFLSQIQGRTYANIFGLVERFINAKILEQSQRHRFGDQVALEAMVRFSDEELKHQELFRRIETMAGEGMPEGYQLAVHPDEVAGVVLGHSTWSVLALTCLIELFTQQHYEESIKPCSQLSGLFQDVFFYHWKEESQHAIIDELEWREVDRGLSDAERDEAVEDLIKLIAAVDGILQAQSTADADYFISAAGHDYSPDESEHIRAVLLKAYRWQYIFSGVEHTRFVEILTELISKTQMQHTVSALEGLR